MFFFWIYCVVSDAPVCVPGQQIQYGTAKSEAADVICQVDANPANVTFRWQFNSSIETLDLPFSQVSLTRKRALLSLLNAHCITDYIVLL